MTDTKLTRILTKTLYLALVLAMATGLALGVRSLPVVYAQGPGTGPGGVGSTDGTSNLRLWLQADAGVTQTGGVSAWADQSGNGLDMAQGTAGAQPTFVAAGLNGQPFLSFDGAGDFLQTAALPTTTSLPVNEATSFIVSLADNTGQQSNVYASIPFQGANRFSTHIPWVGNVYFDMGVCCGTATRIQTPFSPATVGTFYIWGYRADPATGKNIYRNDASIVNNAGTNSFVNQTAYSFSLGLGGPNTYAGDIAEVIIYNVALNSAQRIIVDNYLSSKYDIAISNDRYAGDTAGNGDNDLNVAGIGQESDGSHTLSQSVGLVVADNGYLQDNGDYLLFGHNTTTNSTTGADLPAGVSSRWTRVWYLDATDVGTSGGNLQIGFDFSESGLGGTPSGTYALLYRAGTTGTFSSVATSSTIMGDQVEFSVDAASLADGHYTLGVAAAGIQVLDGTTNIPNGIGSVDFGATTVGTPVVKTFIISNTGVADLTLISPVNLPAGYSTTGFGSTTVPPGGATTLAVQLDATAEGTFAGLLSFGNDDPDENPFTFNITGRVGPAGGDGGDGTGAARPPGIPEPTTLALVGMGLASLAGYARLRGRRK